eukprot:TRINITY_DN7356_c0_g1_i2.p4 TRINITY_DN7356_c0_g1~~TRINITY_DN7356_c0_g1_i2.p4  ORF type:complete len:100 (+),score=9.87 TRINITY_DN7356_c0_g1_i2:601-900(+)
MCAVQCTAHITPPAQPSLLPFPLLPPVSCDDSASARHYVVCACDVVLQPCRRDVFCQKTEARGGAAGTGLLGVHPVCTLAAASRQQCFPARQARRSRPL